MDHGFSEVISKTKVFELHERFFKLPFQATKCKLAGESESMGIRIKTFSFLCHSCCPLSYDLLVSTSNL